MRKGLVALVAGILFSVGVATFAPAQPALACQGGGAGSDIHLLGIIPPWHHYLPCDGNGVDNSIELSDTWAIALALLQGLLRAGGIAAVIYIIWGGVKYINSGGNPENTAKARKTIISAIAGLIIVTSSAVLVEFVFNVLNGGGFSVGNAGQDDGSAAVGRAFNIAYAIIASVSVIYIIVGAIKFATSTGDPGKAASARNTIIYALVGLLVVIAASSITGFVLDNT